MMIQLMRSGLPYWVTLVVTLLSLTANGSPIA